jgi:hypothetical protein
MSHLQVEAQEWIPAWTSPGEQRYLAQYAKSEYSGAGEIVDLGCLLGATTVSLAKGLQSNAAVSNKAGRIHAYDLFEWHPSMEGFPVKPRAYKVGESFLAEFKSAISRFAGYVKIYPGDIINIGWHGGPIEFLLVDADKSWQLAEFIGKVFYPHLIVSKSSIFEQDFKHWFTPWIHIMNYRLRNHLSPHDLADMCTVVFQVKKSIDPSIIPSAQEMKAISKEELDEVYKYSLAVISDQTAAWPKSNIIASKVMFYLHQNRRAEARAVFDDALAQGCTIDSDLTICRRILDEGVPL